MGKMKNLMAKMSDEVKELVKKFPVTMLIVVFITLLLVTVDMHVLGNMSHILDKIYVFSMIWTIGTIFTETWFVKKTNRMISYGLTAGISLVFVQMLTSSEITKGQEELVSRFLAAYIMILICFSIYKSIKNAELKLEEYILQLFRDLFNMTTTYLILNIGVVMLTGIFVQLILDGKWRRYDRAFDDIISWFILCTINDL